jgi:hypothetical protein
MFMQLHPGLILRSLGSGISPPQSNNFNLLFPPQVFQECLALLRSPPG